MLDVVPGGPELEPPLRRGVWQAARRSNKPRTECSGVYV
jgi:hypothetical protein